MCDRMFALFLIPGFLAYCAPLLAPSFRWLFGGAVMGALVLWYRWTRLLADETAYALPGLVAGQLVIISISFASGVTVRAIQLTLTRQSPFGDGLPYTIVGALANVAIVLWLL